MWFGKLNHYTTQHLHIYAVYMRNTLQQYTFCLPFYLHLHVSENLLLQSYFWFLKKSFYLNFAFLKSKVKESKWFDFNIGFIFFKTITSLFTFWFLFHKVNLTSTCSSCLCSYCSFCCGRFYCSFAWHFFFVCCLFLFCIKSFFYVSFFVYWVEEVENTYERKFFMFKIFFFGIY